MEMIGLMQLSIDTPNGAAKVIVDGDLVFKQTQPIIFDAIKRTIYNTNPIDISLVEKNSMTDLLQFYNARTGK